MQKVSPQSLASDPTTSCWVNASAGTGKTKVLIDRLLRLLLNQVPFKKILCITFTKAAAKEMVERLYQILQVWAIIDEDSLKAQLQDLTNKPAPAEIIKRARGLLLQVLDQSPNIQTIHSFCQRLLRIFPVEAEISPQFSLIDEIEQIKFYQKALAQVCNDERAKSPLTYLAQSYQMEQLLDLLIKLPSNFSNISVDDHGNALKECLKIKGKPSFPNINKELNDLISYLQKEDKDLQKSEIIKNFISNKADFNQLKGIFLTQKQEVRKNICSAQLKKKFTSAEELAQKLALVILEYQHALNAFNCFKSTQHFFEFWHIFKKSYQLLKDHQGVLDYDDLITKTVELLNNSDLYPWVMCKIDGGIEHILLDEAQDTSPDQWSVIMALLKDFSFNKQRTIMVVGDYKQSIYSFQGANVELFLQNKDRLKKFIKPWREVDLDLSFRSTPAVLAVVDRLITSQKKGINYGKDDTLRHNAHRNSDWGKVVLWKEIPKSVVTSLEPWLIADKNFINQDRDKLLADFVADKVSNILKDKVPLSSTQKPPQPGDILILLRNRGELISYLTQALKAKKIPVVGRDRLDLSSELAVWDLLSLAAFVNLPKDDYSLACLLKSPLINNGKGITEEQLYEASYNRGALFLFDVLKNKAEEDGLWKNIFDQLSLWQEQARVKSIYSFYASILQKCESYFIQRLGHETKDILEAFLDNTYNFVQKNGSNWMLFLQYWQENDLCLKREEQKNNQLRIMTVHGAKGLQAPIVIFADSQKNPNLRQEDFLFMDKIFMLRPSSDKDCYQSIILKKQLLQKMEEEHRRLLYVMLTRAQDQLYMACMEHKDSEESWYDLIKNTIKELDYTEAEDFIAHSIHSFPTSLTLLTDLPDNVQKPPSWLLTKKPPESALNTPKTVSQNNERLDFGIILHEILEVLPYAKPKIWKEIIKKYNLKEDQTQNLLKLLKGEKFKIFFTQPCVSEVPIISHGKVEGRIDRLSIHPPYLYILDFKSGSKKESIPEKYINQLNQYATALKPIYPELITKKFILWLHDLYLEEVI